MQQLALPFAVLCSTRFDGNRWFESEQMLDAARGAMLFWARCQHPSGAVDEWYRNEYSYCATAFTTYGISEAFLRLRDRIPPQDQGVVLAALGRAARWLAARFNPEVMNQNLAAAAALWNAHQCRGDSEIEAAFNRTWSRTLSHQDREGWFTEYGGADAGYSLLALDLLAALHGRGVADAASAAAPLCRFLRAFACGTGDVAGRLGSRGTEHTFPFGAERFRERIPDAAAIAAHLRGAVASQAACDPASVDDRYLAYFYLPSFVLAASIEADGGPESATPPSSWPRSGLRVWPRHGAYVVCSIRRAAAFGVYAPGPAVSRNLGYWLESSNGRRYATCPWSAVPETVDVGGEDHATAAASCVRVNTALPLVRHEVAFRAFVSWALRWPRFAERFQRATRIRNVVRQKPGPFRFTRSLRWHGDTLLVQDVIERVGTAVVRAIVPVADVEVHSPSARLAGASPSLVRRAARETSEAWASELNRTGHVTLTTTYHFEPDGVVRVDPIRLGSVAAVPVPEEPR
jgi:hypothetical protein